MKNIVPFFWAMAVCIPFCFASIADDPKTADGRLTTGEYATSYITVEGYEEFFVIGGGAERITARDYSYVEVQYTSTPLSNNSGIYDIFVFNISHLLYLGGITEEITIGDYAAAILKGGRIDYITTGYFPNNVSSKITLYCQDGWEWVYEDNEISGITGLWESGLEFNIEFIDLGGSYLPTADCIEVIEVPEPVTLVLLGLGGALIRQKR